jgi:FtsH-binding integral membrane protein
MRSVTVFLIGVGSMVAAYGALALAMTDESPINAPPWLVPAVVVLAGVLAAIVDRRPRGLATVLCGACATVVGFSAWLRLTQGPDIEWFEFALIGLGLAFVALSLGFAPAALVGWLVDRTRHST